ncbi:hypothetical protein [Mucilaginibacter antarcticus]|uniref:hypothetical protein n=1 Tax=Mucilaginibacter antarcticus TaxID=1855725 RepID=UPI00362A51EA
MPVDIQFKLEDFQSTNALVASSPSANYNTFTAFGPTYNINASNITLTNLTGGVQTGTITQLQTAVVLFGFQVTSSAAVTISTLNINSNGTPGSYFGGTARLVSNTTNTYATGVKTTAGTVVFSGNYATVSLTAGNTVTAGAASIIF